MSLGFPPGEPLAGLASLLAGPLLFNDGGEEGLQAQRRVMGCLVLQGTTGVELWRAVGLQSLEAGAGTPLCCGLEVGNSVRVSRPGALLSYLSNIILDPAENGVFLGEGETW